MPPQYLCYLCVILWLTSITEQNMPEAIKTTTPNNLVIINNANATNITNLKNVTVTMERITQPVMDKQIQSQPTGRTLPISQRNFTNDLVDFRPSPQLSTYYEYNKFPVPPVFPEAKHFSVLNINEKAIGSEILPWERPPPNYPTTTQLPWHSRINFPTTQNPFVTIQDHPYPYLFTRNQETTPRTQYSYAVTPQVHYSFETTTQQSAPKHNDNLGIIEKLGGSLFGGKGGLDLQSSSHGSTPSPSSAISPWQKVIKFLTAVIPIGLLLSALTPTIINVSPMGNTTQKGRSLDDHEFARKHLISSLNYINTLTRKGCEERALCELLISSGSVENAEKHAQNLFKLFNEHDLNALGGMDELKKIFQALRNGNCSSIACASLDMENGRTKEEKLRKDN